MATCWKEKAVLVAVYEEKPRKRRLSISSNKKKRDQQQRHHHHHHHLYVHRSETGGGYSRRAELLSYSQRLRESARSGASSPRNPKSIVERSADTSPHHPKCVVVSTTTKEDKPTTQMMPIQRKQKKQPACLEWKCLPMNIFKCLAISQAKRRVKTKKKRSGKSSVKKAKAIMKTFNARTKKGGNNFFSKVMATIQKYR